MTYPRKKKDKFDWWNVIKTSARHIYDVPVENAYQVNEVDTIHVSVEQVDDLVPNVLGALYIPTLEDVEDSDLEHEQNSNDENDSSKDDDGNNSSKDYD